MKNYQNFIKNHLPEIKLSHEIRKTEEALLKLFSEGRLYGTVHTCIGQEFIGVSVSKFLKKQDFIFSNHRGHGHFLSYTGNVDGLIGEVMGKSNGVSGGKGGSQHLCQDNYFSNGIQGGIVPVAAGLAYSQVLNKTNGISVVYIGDGTLGEGALYETLNIASKWNLPLLIVCENNFYAQSTSQSETLSGDILLRAEAFDIKTKELNTWDLDELFLGIEDCISYVRKETKPVFCKVDTYRLMAHSKGDDDRLKSEVSNYWDKDPLSIILSHLKNDNDFTQHTIDLNKKIDDAIKNSDSSPYSELNLNNNKNDEDVIWEGFSFKSGKVFNLIRDSLSDALKKYDDVIIIGEDIKSPYGGAFKCTLGLSDEFPDRVINTPISEAAITGIGNGLALSGNRPVIEIMFGDFMTLAIDQWINHASKFEWMFNEQVTTPIVIRTPMGGKRGYGPTHSQSLEKHFIGVPGTRVLSLHHRFSPLNIYQKLFELNNLPTLIIENKVLYGKKISSETIDGYNLLRSNHDFPIINLKPEIQADITIITCGGISSEVETAVERLFFEEEIIVDLFIPTQIYPFSIHFLKESITSTKKLLVIEEGQGFVSFSSEVIAQVSETYYNFGIKCMRLTAENIHIPTSRPLEDECIPNVNKIINYSKKLYNE